MLGLAKFSLNTQNLLRVHKCSVGIMNQPSIKLGSKIFCVSSCEDINADCSKYEKSIIQQESSKTTQAEYNDCNLQVGIVKQLRSASLCHLKVPKPHQFGNDSFEDSSSSPSFPEKACRSPSVDISLPSRPGDRYNVVISASVDDLRDKYDDDDLDDLIAISRHQFPQK